MFGDLSIIELEAYLRLCEQNMEFLAKKRKLLSKDEQTNTDYDNMLSLRNKLYKEINERLKALKC